MSTRSDKIQSDWRRLVRRLAPGRREFDALTSINFAAWDIPSPRYEGAIDAWSGHGRRLAGQGVPEDHAIPGLVLYLESALTHVLEAAAEKESALALVRLASLVQRSVLQGYASARAVGWQQVDDQERLRLSRDLHDEIGSDLVVLKLCIETIGEELKRERWERIGPKLDEALALVARAVDSVRRLALDLGPAVLEQVGFKPALRLYCKQFAARTGIVVDVREGDLPSGTPRRLETALYRVLQGALSNVLRHSRAKTVKVSVGGAGRAVIVMIIEDDGVGFDSTNLLPSGAFGLAAMRDRIEGLGGRFYVESRPARRVGTRIEVDVPLSPQ